MPTRTQKTPAKKTDPGAKKPKAAGKPKSGAPASGADTYTKPELRDKIKKSVKAGEKGGRPGEWSARKAQLVATEYAKEGGGYKKEKRTASQEHLESWTAEKWQMVDGKKADQGKQMSRYLPKKAWDKLSPAEKKATNDKKKAVSRTGRQVVPNTAAAKKARQQAAK